ncbi:MAG: N(4)-(beta-N-acetylglucosaminyl)-L-asparaginase [Balneolaceae bacterium]
MMNRKNFLRTAAFGGLLPVTRLNIHSTPTLLKTTPVVISTWNFGVEANRAAWEILQEGGSALDAVEAGVRVPEADPSNQSVGYGGFPDREGHVTLDASIMKGDGRCGSVAFLQQIKHPVSVARKVMEESPHIMLVGEGALRFALDQGFEREELLTDNSRKAWQEWMKESEYKLMPNIENHDTIGMLAVDAEGNLAGACSTSGLAFKMHGRVGDSPLIGSALFVDNEAGAATATGHGEEIIRVAGCHLVVELMRQGYRPQEACREAVRRIIKHNPGRTDLQAGFLALSREGEIGAYALQDGFSFAVRDQEGEKLQDSVYEL